MIDLSKKVGFEVYLKESGYLEFGKDILSNPPEPRLFSKAKNFFKNPDARITHDLLYLMYRNVRNKNDDRLLMANDLRYDLTVIFPGVIGDEFNKTVGHYHQLKQGTNISYPEIYEVIYGDAKMLIQELDLINNKLRNVYYIDAKAGDKIVIPSEENFVYGHTTINTTKDFLVLANTQDRNFQSDYSKYLNKNGASYYLLNINGLEKFEKNKKYDFAPTPVRLIALESMLELLLSKTNNLYQGVIKNVEKFSQYLTFPEKCLTMISIKKNYTAL